MDNEVYNIREIHKMINQAYKNIEVSKTNIDMAMSILWEASYKLLLHFNKEKEVKEENDL